MTSQVKPYDLFNSHPFVFNNSKLVKYGESNIKLFHISPIKEDVKFNIQLPTRYARNEYIDIPRISTAPSIIECIMGFNIFIDNSVELFMEYGLSTFCAYSIYRFDNWKALRPNKRLVPTMALCDEYWIYSEGFSQKRIAEMYVTSISRQGLTKKEKSVGSDTFTMVFEFHNIADAKAIMIYDDMYNSQLKSKYIRYTTSNCKRGYVLQYISLSELNDIKKHSVYVGVK